MKLIVHNLVIKYIIINIIMVCIFIFHININNYKKLNIYIGNSFKNYYHLPKHIICKNKYKRIFKCNFLNETVKSFQACIYNGNRKFPKQPNCTFNIIITTEKLSQVKFMKDIGAGKNIYYKLAVDYRLFNNRYHISRPIYSYYNISFFIEESNRNFGNIELFSKRKNFVYIQKVSYKNRQYIVKELMKYFLIDSYGKDLHNKEWPKTISKKNKIELLKQYKFCIAIENSIISWNMNKTFEADIVNNDYVTEKLTDCLIAGCIPIYFGPQNVDLFLPNKCAIINLRNYESINNLTFYLNKLLNNYSLLQYHLDWHNNISEEWIYKFSKEYTFDFCKICRYVKNFYYNI